MKKYRKLLLAFAAVIILALTGCGGNAGVQPSASSGTQPAAQTETETDVEETKFELLEEEPETVKPGEASPEEGDTKEAAEEPAASEETAAEEETEEEAPAISESDTPIKKDELAAYIHEFGHLPDYFITKNEAKELGWVSSKANLWEVAPGCSIGGDRFGNYEGLLPEAPGRKYTECDVGYDGGYRSEKRIIFSNDGLIYYTDDHYNSFELLYGEEE